MVRAAGLEPARSKDQQILSLWCLPIPPYPHIIRLHFQYKQFGTEGGIRTHTEMLLRHLPPSLGLPQHLFLLATSANTNVTHLPFHMPLCSGG